MHLEYNHENFFSNYFNIMDDDKYNFLQRLWRYIKSGHKDTERKLSNLQKKNLVIAFTSKSEWDNTFMDEETLEFIERMKLSDEVKNPIKWWFFIVVFPDKYWMDSYRIPNEDSFTNKPLGDKIKLYYQNRMFDYFDEKQTYDEYDSLTKLRSFVETGDYPISLINVTSEEDSMDQAIKYIQNYIKMSKHRPLKLSFQNLFN